jgi:hypothetical protein
MRQDKRKVKYTMTIAPQRYRGKPPSIEDSREGCRGPVGRFYELLGAKASERKLAQDMAVAETLLAEGFCPEDLAFAVEWAMAHILPIQTFGGTRNFLPQALAAWEGHAEAEQAKQEADVRVDMQYRHEREEQERRQSVAEIRARLPEDVLATLRYRAREALATEGVSRTHLGYEVLVKLKTDELLEQEYLTTDMSPDGGPAEITVT